VLLPTLRSGDIVIIDNLGSHKSKAVRRLIRSAGAKLFFLPKYSPDLNPSSSSPRSSIFCAKPPREPSTPFAPPSAKSSPAFALAECTNYLVNSGYRRT
jgi:hypothetical protein